jgi:hypothetical protein
VVNLVGSNPLSLQTRNNGDLTLGSTINANGGAGTEGPNTGGIGKLGGYITEEPQKPAEMALVQDLHIAQILLQTYLIH